jgi:hypothetical protein
VKPHAARDADGRAAGVQVPRLASNGFADALTAATERCTSINHQHPIAWMFVKGAAVRDGHVARVEDTSDHYPGVATIALRERGVWDR